jgi:hypothetical protein
MKFRPQFQLRFRSEEQAGAVNDMAAARGLSVNEWVLRQIEASGDLKKGLAEVAGLAVRPPLTPRVEGLSGKTEHTKAAGEGGPAKTSGGHVRLPKGGGGVGAVSRQAEDRHDVRVPESRPGAGAGDSGREAAGVEESLEPDDFIPEPARKDHKCPRCEKANTVTPWGPGQMRCSACGINFAV